MELPSPNAEEESFLRVVIKDWETRTPLQRAIATSVARGNNTVQKVAENLGMEVAEVRKVLPTVWGILRDFTNDKLYLK
jgi:hypothetical protein